MIDSAGANKHIPNGTSLRFEASSSADANDDVWLEPPCLLNTQSLICRGQPLR